MARPNRPLGDREEQTFKLAGQVPPWVRRIPKEGQATREVDGKLYYLVGYVREKHLTNYRAEIADEVIQMRMFS